MNKDKPHIVLAVMDTARASNFSCYGYDRRTSPHIDEIAEKGIIFKNAISPSPWTLPSHVSMFTGLYPSEHGLTEDRILEGKNIYGLSKKHSFERFLPQMLKIKGYQTVGISNNPWISGHFGFDQGFDFFFENWKTSENSSLFRKILRLGRRLTPQMFHPALNNLRSHMRWLYRSDSGAGDSVMALENWFAKSYTDQKPVFIFLNFMEPHLPYIPPKPFDRMFIENGTKRGKANRVNQDHIKYIAQKTQMDPSDFEILRGLYDGEIAYLDSKLREIFQYLDASGLLDRTFLIITSDHGENIGEHGLMGHQFCLYDTLLRVPLVIKFPGASLKGKFEEKYVQLSDIYHTILDILGIEIEGRNVSQRSLLNQDYSELIFAEHEVPRIALSSLKKRFPNFKNQNLDQELRCLYLNDMKYIWNSKSADEMYDLKADPGEEIDLISAKAEQSNQLYELLKKKMESLKMSGQGEENAQDLSKKEINSEIKEKLRDLGYI
jgi:arylsulfatase A-like enzyme